MAPGAAVPETVAGRQTGVAAGGVMLSRLIAAMRVSGLWLAEALGLLDGLCVAGRAEGVTEGWTVGLPLVGSGLAVVVGSVLASALTVAAGAGVACWLLLAPSEAVADPAEGLGVGLAVSASATGVARLLSARARPRAVVARAVDEVVIEDPHRCGRDRPTLPQVRGIRACDQSGSPCSGLGCPHE
ncbi:hypothetical protein GCM10009599_23480 [Luteococcus peritonei]